LSKTKLNRLAFCNWQYRFDASSFNATSDEGVIISARYSSLPKIVVEDNYVMFYMSESFAVLVPKEAFHTETDFNTVSGYFQ